MYIACLYFNTITKFYYDKSYKLKCGAVKPSRNVKNGNWSCRYDSSDLYRTYKPSSRAARYQARASEDHPETGEVTCSLVLNRPLNIGCLINTAFWRESDTTPYAQCYLVRRNGFLIETGSEIFRGSAEFRGFPGIFGHPWDQCKSGETPESLCWGGGIFNRNYLGHRCGSPIKICTILSGILW